ncbi:MAG: AhpC/TSA family protein [Chitinophagaceae bacterium]|nr:AhpC/TSA family protein [Chitinophagaceae bacterium]
MSVTYKNADKLPGKTAPDSPVKLVLEEVSYGGERPVLLDSTILKDKEGKVTLKGHGAGEEGVYELIVENGPILLLVNDEPEVDVEIDLSKRDNYYTVSGSPASSELKKFIEEYSDRTVPVNLAMKELDSLKQFFAPDSIVLAATSKKNAGIKALNSYLEGFLSKSGSAAVSMFALGMSSRSLQPAEFDNTLKKVVERFPANKTLNNLKTNFENQKAQIAAQDKKNEAGSGSWVGKPAPDLSMPSVSGESITVSSFKGKYVLLDFWASWCGPCREENPNVVKAYQKYKGKNFTVLGVSLDKSREAWIKAIQDDKLDWPQMSDLQYWNSKAVDTYKFEGIPFNVLIDPQGIVIAQGLRGFDLENKLAELLK